MLILLRMLFGNPGINVRLATTPGLSQLATAFFTAIAKPSPRWFVLANFSHVDRANTQSHKHYRQ